MTQHGGSLRSSIDRWIVAAVPEPKHDLEREVARGSVMAGLFGGDGDLRRVGRYALRRVLGEGAHGVVFAGRDPQLDRPVAVKVVTDADRQLVGPHTAEARALARLSHPNVVEVYDTGIDGETLYIVMELVEGENLECWLARRPPVEAILATFVAAGRGLAAAHRAGLVHRDFKPTNVLVGTGVVKVADFGLARARVSTIDEEGRPASSTDPQARTPVYMAPEQHRGADVDARADQFAFCVALWEALDGRPPFSPEAASLEAAKIAGPPRCSAALASGRVDWILRRGLAADPRARWPSMDALLDALGQGTARPLRSMAAGVLAIAVVVGGASLASGRDEPSACPQTSDAAQPESPDARVAAEVEALACATDRDSARVGSQGLDDATDASALRAIVERERARGEGVPSADLLPGIDALLHRAHEGGHRALSVELHLWKGRVLLEIDRPHDAVTSFRAAYFIALDAGLEDKALRATLELAFAHHVRLRDADDGRRWLDTAWALLDRLGRPPELHSRVLATWGSVQVDGGSAVRGVASMREAIALCDASGACPEEFLVTLTGNFGVALVDVGDLDEAIDALQRAHDMTVARYGPDHLETAIALDRLGACLSRRGDTETARRHLERALAILEDRLGPEHRNALMTAGGLAQLAHEQGDLLGAQAMYRQVLRALEAATGREVERAQVLNNLGVVALDLGDLDEAARSFRAAADAFTVAIGRYDPQVGICLLTLGYVLVEQGRAEEAIDVLEETLAIVERQDTSGGRRRGDARYWLARALVAAGRDAARARMLAEAAATDFAALGEGASERRAEVKALLATLR